MNWFKNFFAMHQDEAADGTPGSAASAGNSDAGGAAPEAQAGNEGAPASEAGNGGTPPDFTPMDFEYKGRKVSITSKDEALKRYQLAEDYTQKMQGIAKLKQDYNARLERSAALLAELEAKRNKEQSEADPQAEPEDKVSKLEKELTAMRDERNVEAWEKISSPILQKFPDVPEWEFAEAFKAAVDAGEVENNTAGLEEVAARMNEHYTGEITKRLEKHLSNKESPLTKTHNDKVISEFLSDTNNPKLQEYAQKVIADYTAGKIKLRNAVGDTGKGAGTGSGAKKDRTIAEIAAAHRTAP